mgnify:CR=1 FL=1
MPDGTFNYKPKRDLNGIIQCRSTIDQEACIYADNVRKLRQHEYDSAILYTDKENEIAAQNERSEQDFIKYFNSIISKRHPNSSNSIIVNWRRVGELLKIYSQGQPIPFKDISVKLLEDIKMFLLRAPMGGNKKGTIVYVVSILIWAFLYVILRFVAPWEKILAFGRWNLLGIAFAVAIPLLALSYWGCLKIYEKKHS